MDQFALSLFEILERIDRESVQIVGGRPAGLQAYQHAKRAAKRWEESWSARIAELLPNCCTEQRYPNTRNRCDLVITINEYEKLWLEVKGAWRRYLWNDQCIENKSFRKHLVYSTFRDVQKLSSLSSAAANYVGLLLIGFDRCDGDIESHVRIFSRKSELVSGWTSFHKSWDDPHIPQLRTYAWLWTRRLTELGNM